MSTEPIVNRCPKCQGPLPASAPQGLCPKCLLAAVIAPTEAGQGALASAPPPSLDTVAAAFPQLEILELIGSGGMGVVYRARQPRLDRFVALKLLPQALAADAAFAERFNREARTLARLSHPNIVAVHDFGQSGGFCYLLMEFVDGVNLRQAMEAGRFTPQQAFQLVPKICDALQYAHDEGILHRDIKPSNLLLDTRGRIKIADFGIAKLLGDRRQDITLTASGAAVGTPQYMAPEQLEHPQDVDQRADIYSLGVVFYEMLTGELPIGRFAPPSEKAAVDARVDDVVFHTLEKEREKRFRSAGEVKTSVEAITANPRGARQGAKSETGAYAGSRAAGPRELRVKCLLSSPEHLRTFTGRFGFLEIAKGELRLDAERLTFVSHWQSVVIPLADIRELGIGHYSRLAKPVRLDYLAVTFDQGGGQRTLLFTPAAHAVWLLPWEANKQVVECFQAVREAVIARTGAPPAVAPITPTKSFAAAFDEALPIIVICGVTGAVTAFLLARSRRSGWENTPQTGGASMLYRAVHTLFSTVFPGFPPVGGAELLLIGSLVALGLGLIVITVRRLRSPRALGFGGGEPLAGVTSRGTGLRQTPANPVANEPRTLCYYSTPERMRDCFPGPAAHIFMCKGQLALEANQLRFLSPWQTEIIIGLKDIQDLSIGQFKMWHSPWVMKYERLNFLSVTFRQGTRTVCLTPTAPGMSSTAEINALVSDWFLRIQQAVRKAAGAAPRMSDPAAISISAQPAWNRKGVPLCFGFVAMWALAFNVPGGLNSMLGLFLLVLCLLFLVGSSWYSLGFLQANHALKRGNLDAVTSEDPPVAEPVR